MLQSLRDKIQGWPAIIIFGILSLLLAGWGLGSYVVGHQETWVAKVGKHEISQQDYQQQMNNLRQQESEQQGDEFDAAEFQKPEVKQRVLDGMIDRYLLRQSADQLGLVVTTAAVRQHIASTQVFQVNGQFDADTYRSVLANNQLSPTMYQQQVKSQLETQLLPGAIAATSTIGKEDVEQYLQLQLQTRDLHYVVLPRPPLEHTEVSDAEVKEYYQAHRSAFMNPERVAVDYIELDGSDLKPKQPIDEDSLKARYEQEKSRFVQPEQRLVSHILIKVPNNATPEQQKQALDEARKVDAKARAKGADFAALAKKYSDDAGSRRDGGNLGWLQKGVTNQAFQDAMFAMHKGEVSKPVLGPDGYHIIWLRGIRAGKVKPFSEVRDELAAQARKTQREHEYSEVAGKLTDLVYENPSSLEPAAKELDLTIHKSGLFSRDGTSDGIASHPKVVKAAFSDNVLDDDNSSDPITLGSDHMVIVHLAEHKAAAVKPLDEVAATIRQKILDERIDAKADKQARSLLARLEKGESLDDLVKGTQLGVQKLTDAGREQPGVSPALLRRAFAMAHPDGDKSRFALASLGGGSFALLQLDAVHPGDPEKIPEAQRRMLQQQMRQFVASTATEEWLKLLKSGTKIQISRERMQ